MILDFLNKVQFHFLHWSLLSCTARNLISISISSQEAELEDDDSDFEDPKAKKKKDGRKVDARRKVDDVTNAPLKQKKTVNTGKKTAREATKKTMERSIKEKGRRVK